MLLGKWWGGVFRAREMRGDVEMAKLERALHHKTSTFGSIGGGGGSGPESDDQCLLERWDTESLLPCLHDGIAAQTLCFYLETVNAAASFSSQQEKSRFATDEAALPRFQKKATKLFEGAPSNDIGRKMVATPSFSAIRESA
jgi:hypothetical protein